METIEYKTYFEPVKSASFTTAQLVRDSSSVGHFVTLKTA